MHISFVVDTRAPLHTSRNGGTGYQGWSSDQPISFVCFLQTKKMLCCVVPTSSLWRLALSKIWLGRKEEAWGNGQLIMIERGWGGKHGERKDKSHL
jgi:hypothetical protein